LGKGGDGNRHNCRTKNGNRTVDSDSTVDLIHLANPIGLIRFMESNDLHHEPQGGPAHRRIGDLMQTEVI